MNFASSAEAELLSFELGTTEYDAKFQTLHLVFLVFQLKDYDPN